MYTSVLCMLVCPVFFCSLRSSSSKLAQLTLEQMLEHLDSLRLSLSNTKNNCKFVFVLRHMLIDFNKTGHLQSSDRNSAFIDVFMPCMCV